MTAVGSNLEELYLAYDFCDEGLDQNRGPTTTALSGTSYQLFDSKATVPELSLDFDAEGTVSWCRRSQVSGKAPYSAVEVRPGTFFVDWLSVDDHRLSVSLVLRHSDGGAALMWNQLPHGEHAKPNLFERIRNTHDLSAARADVHNLGINATPMGKFAKPTSDLVGKRVLCSYGSGSFEHVYLNQDVFCWHCVAGSGAGAADVDPYHQFRVDDNLYLLVWREKIAPAIGVVLLDFDCMRSNGKLHYEKLTKPGTVVNYLVGAQLTLLNETSYQATMA